MPRTLQMLRGNAANKPFLADGQMYLEKDTKTLVIQNNSEEIRLADSTQISSLQDGLSSTNQTLGSIGTNVATLNSTVSNLPIANKYSGSLSTIGWTPSGSEYYFDVTIPAMTATMGPLLMPQELNQTQKDNWNTLLRVESASGYCRVYGSQVFTTSVPIYIYY